MADCDEHTQILALIWGITRSSSSSLRGFNELPTRLVGSPSTDPSRIADWYVLSNPFNDNTGCIRNVSLMCVSKMPIWKLCDFRTRERSRAGKFGTLSRAGRVVGNNRKWVELARSSHTECLTANIRRDKRKSSILDVGNIRNFDRIGSPLYRSS